MATAKKKIPLTDFSGRRTDSDMKKCLGCSASKPLTTANFYADARATDGFCSRCKDCVKAAAKVSYLANKEQKIQAAARWRRENPERYAEHVAKHKSGRTAESFRETKRKSAAKRAHVAIPKRRERERMKWASDPDYRFGKVLAHQIRKAIGKSKSGAAWESLLGYSCQELRAHLERQFTGSLGWGNYGSEWHIDHIRPVSSFDFGSDPNAIRECWSLTNLRPLAVEENLRKGAKRLYLL